MCSKPFFRSILLRTEAHWPTIASQSEALKLKLPFSAIGQHLLQNPTCTREYNNKFSILACGHTSFHLSTLEATYIKTSKPNICKQKEFVYGLKITHYFPLLPLVASFTNHDVDFSLFFSFLSIVSPYK